jgi:ATP-dependent Clp protease ATP-binding subunit ClpC
MEGNFSNRVRDVISYSREEAIRLGHDYIGTEHLLLGIIREGEGIAVKILRNLGADLLKLKKAVEDTVRATGGTLTVGNIPLTKQAEKVLKITYLEAKLYKSDVIGTEHLLLSLLRDDENIAAQILQQGFSITYDSVRAELDSIISGKSSPPLGAAAGGGAAAGRRRTGPEPKSTRRSSFKPGFGGTASLARRCRIQGGFSSDLYDKAPASATRGFHVAVHL